MRFWCGLGNCRGPIQPWLGTQVLENQRFCYWMDLMFPLLKERSWLMKQLLHQLLSIRILSRSERKWVWYSSFLRQVFDDSPPRCSLVHKKFLEVHDELLRGRRVRNWLWLALIGELFERVLLSCQVDRCVSGHCGYFSDGASFLS